MDLSFFSWLSWSSQARKWKREKGEDEEEKSIGNRVGKIPLADIFPEFCDLRLTGNGNYHYLSIHSDLSGKSLAL